MRGATPAYDRDQGQNQQFQSTRPMRGATGTSAPWLRVEASFQSTRPMRGATKLTCPSNDKLAISIHAPHAGRDLDSKPPCWDFWDFNPRAPCGARRQNQQKRTNHQNFNPRAPCGARRHAPPMGHKGETFQSTRPMRGATFYDGRRTKDEGHFNPRAPCGARHHVTFPRRQHHHFNPRAPCGARPQD